MSGAKRTQGGAANDAHQPKMLPRLRGSLKPGSGLEIRKNVSPKLTRASNRTVPGPLLNKQRARPQNRCWTKQDASSCQNANFDKACHETTSSKQPAFQTWVDEPEGTIPMDISLVEEENLMDTNEVPEISHEIYTYLREMELVNNTAARLQQPLAMIGIPSAVDVNILVKYTDSPMDISLVEEENLMDTDQVPEFPYEIYTYLREMELKTRPEACCIKTQPDITSRMRAILVDWLVKVGEKYKLQNETLYLAVNYMDRFLSSVSILRGNLQLVGTAAMLLASKFEEMYPPEVAQFLYITGGTYTVEQVLNMAHLVLEVLSFNLEAPTLHQFLKCYTFNHSVGKWVESLAMYLGELSLVHSDPFLKYLPSEMASAAYILANHTVTGGSWPKSLIEKTGYSLKDLMPCVKDLHKTYLKAAQHAQQSVREKYRTSKYHEVSLIEAPAKLLL